MGLVATFAEKGMVGNLMIGSALTGKGRTKMTDMEKVIKGLESQLDDLQKYADSDDVLTLTQDQAKDILALLKKQEPKEIDLVEQSLFAKIGLCPECGEKLHSGMHPNYCGFCGRAVKWND